MTQVTDIRKGLVDSAGDYDWSAAGNWSSGVPGDGDYPYLNVANMTSLDNLGDLTLHELFVEQGNLLIGAGSLTIGFLELFPDFNPFFLEAEDGATVNIQSLYDPSNQATIVADAGSHVVYQTSGSSTGISSTLNIAGAASGLAGGVVTIDSGYTVHTSITLEAAGATLDLDDLATATPVSGTGGVVNLNSASVTLSGGYNAVHFLSGDDDIADLSGTSGQWDVVYGSNGTVNLTSAQASIVGGGDAITADVGSRVSVYNTAGADDSFTGSGAYIIATNAIVNVSGGSNTITFVGADDATDLSATNGAWDIVYGSNANIVLSWAQASIVGGDDIIVATPDSYASLYGTLSSTYAFYGSDDQIIINGALAIINGSADSITATTGSFAYLETTDDGWDAVYGSNISVSVSGAGDDAPDGGHAAIVGGDDSVNAAADSVVSLLDTGNSWDTLDDSVGTIILTDAKTTLTGASDTIWESGASAVSLTGTSGTWDTIHATGGEVDLVGGSAGEPLASVVGGDDTITMTGTAYASLYQTGGAADIVTGSNDVVALTDAQASLTGNDDAVDFVGASALTLNGQFETLRFAAALGTASIAGFDASDSLHLSTADWANFAALQTSGDLAQVGDDTIIRLDGSNSITLTNVTASSLTSANFVFSSHPYGG